MIRKGMVMFAVVTAFVFVSTPSFAGLFKDDISKGLIVSIDEAKGEMTVADSRSGTNIIYKVDSDVISSFQEDQIVIVRSDSGSSVAKSVKLVEKKR